MPRVNPAFAKLSNNIFKYSARDLNTQPAGQERVSQINSEKEVPNLTNVRSVTSKLCQLSPISCLSISHLDR